MSAPGGLVPISQRATSSVRRAFMRFAGGETLTRGIAAASRTGRVRVLAYHDVTDPVRFELQLRHLTANWTPVSGDQVAAARDGEGLPPGSVWVTFDDGSPAVVEQALPLLRRYGIPAALFVCPGYVDTTEPFWWEIVGRAAARGLAAGPDGRSWSTMEAVAAAKTMPDTERRALVDRLTAALAATGGNALTRPQLTSEHLRAWCTAGLEVGNHTWDHPCLNRCPPEEQDRQVREAHEWLAERLSEPPGTFAYPNGNLGFAAEQTLRTLGYRVALGFDHRVARVNGTALRVSRLRVDTTAQPERFRSVVSGVHAVAYRAVPRSRASDERLRKL